MWLIGNISFKCGILPFTAILDNGFAIIHNVADGNASSIVLTAFAYPSFILTESLVIISIKGGCAFTVHTKEVAIVSILEIIPLGFACRDNDSIMLTARRDKGCNLDKVFITK